VEDFRRVLDERAIQPPFQPLIDLQHRHVLGYEALARGPMGSALESPAALVRGRLAGRQGGRAGLGLLRVVVEVTERAVAGDPARLLATVAQARTAGWGWPWTTSAPPRPAWPCRRSSALT
jgi:EAL domain-containing protein (putative c-di-GMP-specific phosphodiesterase class I)